MTAARRQGATGVHSVDRFVYTVPDLAEAERFYTHFGLDVRRQGGRIDLYAHGHPQRWALIFAGGAAKRRFCVSHGGCKDDLPGGSERTAGARVSWPAADNRLERAL